MYRPITTASSRALRVIHILPSTDDAGAENQARYLLEGLCRTGVEVELAFFRRGRAHARFEKLGIPMYGLGSRGPLIVDSRRRARALRRLVAARRVDIVHAWLYEGAVVGALAIPRPSPTRLVIAQRSGDALARDRLRMRVLRILRGRVDHALANSDVGRRLLVDVGYEPGRVSLVPNAIPEDRIAITRGRDEVRAALDIPNDVPVICTVARIDRTKDLPGLMQAMEIVAERFPGARLVLVGANEPELREHRVQIPPHALVLGWLDHPADFMAASDVIAIPSWSEGHSNVAGEALRLGLPIATTNAGAHPALVARSGGRVVPARRPELLADAITGLIVDPPPREQVSAAARSELAPEVSLETTLAVYERLLRDRA